MSYYPTKNSSRFTPKKPIRSFRDLEVYQLTLQSAVVISKGILPKLEKMKFPLLEGVINCSLSIPLFVAESHSLRFSDFKQALATIEKAMLGCNKMIVYLEEAQGLYGENLDAALVNDLSLRYVTVRGKMLRLERSWQKYQKEYDATAKTNLR